jgi:hypothetical protein
MLLKGLGDQSTELPTAGFDNFETLDVSWRSLVVAQV